MNPQQARHKDQRRLYALFITCFMFMFAALVSHLAHWISVFWALSITGICCAVLVAASMVYWERHAKLTQNERKLKLISQQHRAR
jgi:predicted MFS family arabinose efflux permease